MTETGKSASLPIPRRIPAVLEDRILYWMRNSFDSCIRCVIEFDGRVDADRMAKALRLTLDAEPVLGCRFVPGAFRQYWERMENLDTISHLEILETSEYDHDIGGFIASRTHMDLLNGPQVKAWLLRSGKDTLIIGIHHLAFDGGGIKEYLSILSSIYRNLSGNPGYRPGVSTNRSLMQVFKNFSAADYLRIMRRGLRDVSGFMFPVVRKTPPSMNKPFSCPVMMIRTIENDLFATVREYGRRRNATINDMLLAAYLRAFYGEENSGEDFWPRIVGTVDLRRYIPGKKGEAICNLSGFTYLTIGPKLGVTFDDTLTLVRNSMSAYKKDFVGLGPVPLSAVLFRMLPFPAALWVHDRLGNAQKRQASSGRDIAPLYTNMGNIDAKKIDFGDAAMRHVFFTTPISTPPVLAAGMTGFGESITISAGFYETTVPSGRVKRILDAMEEEFYSLKL